MKRLFLLFFILFLTLSAWAQLPHRLPVKNYKLHPDERIYKDSTLINFLYRMQKAVDIKNKKYLLSIVSPTIQFGQGKEERGIDKFTEKWQLDDYNSEIWRVLEKLLAMGGTFSDFNAQNQPIGVVFPYVFAMEMPNDTAKYNTVMAVTGIDVRVREYSNLSAQVLGELTYEVVYCNPDRKASETSDDFTYIETFDKRLKGYVYSDYIYSPLDYRMFLRRIKNKWVITSLMSSR